jgi:hypothetical protein
MSRKAIAKEICERALRLIGAFPISEGAPDSEEMNEALHWLDMNLAQLATVARLPWLFTSTVSFNLDIVNSSYDLRTALAEDYPANGYFSTLMAWTTDSNGNRGIVDIVRRQDYEDRANDTIPGGCPSQIFIDRTIDNRPTLYTNRIPSQTGYIMNLVISTLGQTVSNNWPTGNPMMGFVDSGVPEGWQRWAVLQVAHDIGGGAVRKVSAEKLDGWEKSAATARNELLGAESQKTSTPGLTRSMDFDYWPTYESDYPVT